MNNPQNPGKSGMGSNQDSRRSQDSEGDPKKAGQQINTDRPQKRDPLGEDKIGPDRE
jgi:hypothetical protein